MPKSDEVALIANRFPAWLTNEMEDTKPKAQAVANHEAGRRFVDGTIPQNKHHALLRGFLALIERFPKFLVLNLL